MTKIVLSLSVFLLFLLGCGSGTAPIAPKNAHIEMKKAIVLDEFNQYQPVMLFTCVDYENPDECISLLRGFDGSDGEPGANGQDGLNGSNGANGSNGSDGQDGDDGSPGNSDGPNCDKGKKKGNPHCD